MNHHRITASETQITESIRWVRVKIRGEMEWDQVPCFQFTTPDGGISKADGLTDDQVEIFKRQQVERADAELDELVSANGF